MSVKGEKGMLEPLKVLSRIAPDLMADIGRRAQVLSSIESMQPVGRRALAARLNLPEREVRAAAAALNVPTQKPKMTTNRTAVPVEPAVLQVRPVMPVMPVAVPAPTNMESITTDMMPNLEPAVPVDME